MSGYLMAGKGMKAVGATVQAIGSKAMGEMNADQLRVQRYMTYVNSDLIDIANKYNSKELAAQKKKVLGAQNAAVGRSGVIFDGSVAEISLDTAYNFAKEKINMDIQDDMAKMQLDIQRGQLEQAEKQTRKAGTISLIGGLLNAGGSMMGG